MYLWIDNLRLTQKIITFFDNFFTFPPASEVSREVANLIERKNPHAPVYGVKECVCLLQTLTPIISGLAEQNGLKFF